MKRTVRTIIGACFLLIGLGLVAISAYALLHTHGDVVQILSFVSLAFGGTATLTSGIEILRGGNIKDILHRLHLAS